MVFACVDVRGWICLVWFWVWTFSDALDREMSGLLSEGRSKGYVIYIIIFGTYDLAENKAMSDEYMNKEFTMMMKHKKHKSFVADNTKVVAWSFFIFSIQSIRYHLSLLGRNYVSRYAKQRNPSRSYNTST